MIELPDWLAETWSAEPLDSMGAAGRYRLRRSAPRRCSRDRPEGNRGSVARLIGVCSGATLTALRSVQDRTRRPPQTLLGRAGRGPVLPSGLRVGDQTIPQAADQERPLGDDVRAADGTTFVGCCGPPGSYKQVLPWRPPATLPSTSVGATRCEQGSAHTGGRPATTELIQPLGRRRRGEAAQVSLARPGPAP